MSEKTEGEGIDTGPSHFADTSSSLMRPTCPGIDLTGPGAAS